MKKNALITQEEIDKMLEEKMKLYAKQHTAWIVLKNGNTYIGYDVCDYVTEKLMMSLMTLLDLMAVSYSTTYPYGKNEEYYVIIHGEDRERADFIQKFFDNGYRLSWR